MTGISCTKDLITARYDYLKKNMSPDSHLSIFNIKDWKEPWGFGRDNIAAANKIYAEALVSIGFASDLKECDSLSADEFQDLIFVILRSSDQFGIVYIVDRLEELPDLIEDLFNHVALQVPNKTSAQLKQVQEPKKPDNLVISRMKIFSHELPNFTL